MFGYLEDEISLPIREKSSQQHQLSLEDKIAIAHRVIVEKEKYSSIA